MKRENIFRTYPVGMHHLGAATECIIPTQEHGRVGVMDVFHPCDSHMENLAWYLNSKHLQYIGCSNSS
jgi:hypothetical protein